LIKEAVGFGNTIDEAKENAIKNLGVSEFEDIQVEIVKMPKKKVLGLFGGAQAEVKAFIELPDKKTNTKKNNKSQPKKEKAEKTASQKEKPVKAKPEKEENKPEVKVEVKPEPNDYNEPVDAATLEENSPAKKAVEYIKTILTAFGCQDISIKVASRENGSLVILDGEDISILIGRRGETLDAVQYLASLAANNGGGHHKISLNIGNYREKREETLVALAKRISEQVLKTEKSRTLEPMNPYERRIIHTAVQNIDGVISTSFGEGSARRIVISKEGVPVRPPRINDNRSRGRKGRRPSQAKSQTVESVTREPKRDSDIPLYGKIN